MAEVRSAAGVAFEYRPIVIIGAGAAGLCAALSASEAGADVVVLERDPVPAGSSALSAGLIPAAGTSIQRAMGIDDTAQRFAADVQKKNSGEADPEMVRTICEAAAVTIEWLAGRYGFPFEVIDNFGYPGHSAHRMHGLPTRSGAELVDRLRSAVEAAGVPILTGSHVSTLFAEADGTIAGIGCRRGATEERIGCSALILACNGYGGNRELVRRYIPEMADGLYFGHAGNQGDALLWGEQLGAVPQCLSGYQGHGSVAVPHGILITWAAISEGGFQVNRHGRRFSNEALGYSEQAAEVLKQTDGIAFDIFDGRIADIARQFPDFRDAERAGAVVRAETMDDLAKLVDAPAAQLKSEFTEIERASTTALPDRFGRTFTGSAALKPPYLAIKITGALFHTQGGLAVTRDARVRRADGTAFPNLYAAGGAAVGVSGTSAKGYLSGNGLLTATVLGRLAGIDAATVGGAAGNGS
jgi:fumarate reductase flavoprotein subunit